MQLIIINVIYALTLRLGISGVDEDFSIWLREGSGTVECEKIEVNTKKLMRFNSKVSILLNFGFVFNFTCIKR